MNFLKWLMDILFGWVPYAPKAIWGMLLLKHKGSWPHALRAMGFLGLFGWLLIWGLSMKIDYDDFSTKFPSYHELNIDSGTLKYIKYAKRKFDLGLIKSDGSDIHIQGQYQYFSGIVSWYRDRKGILNRELSYPVTIRWFPLFHGSVWVAEIKRNGRIVVSYEQSKQYYQNGQKLKKQKYLYGFWLPFIIFVMIIIFEASAIRKYPN